MTAPLTRRRLLGAGSLGLGSAALAACDRLNGARSFRELLGLAEDWNLSSQRLLGAGGMAREFSATEMSPVFRANGNRSVSDSQYLHHLETGFTNWALVVDGLVRKPLAFPLEALKSLPQRAQITRHDCVEGWSAIGQWQGPQLRNVLAIAGLLPQARFVVFHCADSFGTTPYYESIDLADALHPQTILAWKMNGKPLSVEHGAPIRMRVERQLGYKHAKFVMRIEVRSGLDGVYGGKGGYWEDAAGYQWYAGI